MSSNYDGDSSDGNDIFLVGIVLIGIGVGLLLCCIIRLLNRCTESPVPNVNTGDIELRVIDDVNGHQEILLIPIPMENFIFVHGESECIICLEEFDSNVRLANTLCGHAFHLHCLRSWNARNANSCQRVVVI